MPTTITERPACGSWTRVAFMTLIASAAVSATATSAEAHDLAASDLAGPWVATATHAGESRPFALEFAPTENHEIVVKLSNPAIHVWGVPIAKATVEGGHVKVGSLLTLEYDPAAGTLSGVIPAAFVPLYELPVVFRRGLLERAPRTELTAPVAKPVWTFEAGAPLWADPAWGGGVVYAGADDGRLHALDARTGKELWSSGDQIASWNHFSGISLANGQVYINDYQGNLYCFGLKK